MNLAGLPLDFSPSRIEHGYGKKQLAKIVPMEVLTPASPSDLPLCVPKTPSTSCDQVIFVDQATDAGLSSDAVPRKIDRLG